jgi:hypothetical protein
MQPGLRVSEFLFRNVISSATWTLGFTRANGVKGQSLTAEDQLFLLLQAGPYLTATRGHSAPEARICYERAESLCHSLNRPLLLYMALLGQWHYSLLTDKLSATMQVAKRVYSLERGSCAELHRLRGMFLTAVGGDESQIEASFCAAIRTAREQKSTSLATRAEATYAD